MSDAKAKGNDFYIHRKVALSMGTYNPKDEDLHLEFKQTNTSKDLNETQFFGFSVPEARIHSVLYTWCHPNLNTMSAGVLVGQGKCTITTAIDMLDFRTFLGMDELTNGLLSYKTSGGYEVEVIEAGKTFRTKYLDKDRKNSFDVLHTAIHAPCVWSSNVHFEQVMKTKGEVTIRGKRYDVDGTHVRDRSWGESRGLAPVNCPPVSWITGAFDDGFAFHVTAFDSSDLNPIWKGHFDLAPNDNLRFGWVIVDGKQAAVQSVRKLTHYDSDFMPKRVELEIGDEHGRTFTINGEITGGFPFNPWHAARWVICLFRWTRSGASAKGYGDVQDGQWSDFLVAMSR